jgi:hypothetical protein
MAGMSIMAAVLALLSVGFGVSALASKRGWSQNMLWVSEFCGDLAVTLPAISWTYSWGPSPPNVSCPLITAGGPVKFEPMIWGKRSINDTIFSVSATHILGFNEPNGQSQSNLTPAQAAALWPTVAAKAKAAGLQLVAPVPSGTDVAWLDSFFALCGCEAEVAVIAAHPYVCSGAALKRFLDTWSKYNKPLWITEFNCGDGMANATAAAHLTFMREALPILDADSRVVRYAWMSGRNLKVPGSALISGSVGHVLTELGKFYVTL